MRRSMTDSAARTAAAGSRDDLGLRLIDDFDGDLANGTIARSSIGILLLRSLCCSYKRRGNSSLRWDTTKLDDVWSLRSMQTGISLLTTLLNARRNKGWSVQGMQLYIRVYLLVICDCDCKYEHFLTFCACHISKFFQKSEKVKHLILILIRKREIERSINKPIILFIVLFIYFIKNYAYEKKKLR